MTVLFLVTALANAIWQPLVIAGITWGALRISRCTNATTRHAVWTIALVASVLVPLVSAVPVLRVETPARAPISTVVRPVSPATHSVTAPMNRVLVLPVPAVHRAQFSIPKTVAFWLAAIWGLAALVILARLATSFFYLERLKHDALPFPVDRRNLLARWDQAEKGSRDVRICVSSEIGVPIAVGIFDAMILLPSDLVEELEANDLDRVLLHELAHVRRSDDWVNLFERVALALMFFSPGIYLIARQMDLEREVACDDWVLEQAAENVPYARCLAHIVEITQWPYRAVAAPGVFVTRKSMSIRIERLLARGRDVRIRLALVPSLISLIAIVAIVVAGGFVSPTIAYTLDQTVPAITPKSAAPTISRTAARATAKPIHTETHVHVQTSAAASVPAPSMVHVHIPPVHVDTRAFIEAAFARVAAAQAQATPVVVASESGYLDDLAAAGLKNLSPEDVIMMKSVGVTGEYIRRMRDAGLGDLSPRTLVELKSVGVTPDYVGEMRRNGLAAQRVREWMEMKSVGVTPEYVGNLAKAGYPNLAVNEYVELKSMGIDSDYIEKLASHGFRNLPVHKLVEMKSMGIEL